MRKHRSSMIVICLCFLIILFFPSTHAVAAKQLEFWVSPQGNTAVGAVSPDIACWYSEKDKQYYLLLPAMVDASRLTIHFTQVDTMSIGGLTLRPGDVTKVFVPGKTLNVQTKNGKYKLSVLQSANVPAIWIETLNGSLKAIHAKKTNRETADMLMLSPNGNTVYQGSLEHFRGRGHASFAFDKKPYQIKLTVSTDLLGYGKAKKWILLAMFTDYSLLRNTIAFDMAADAGLPYSPNNAHIDLYIDREYKGTYLLCDKIEIGKTRVSIPDLEKNTEALNDKPLSEYKRVGKNNYTKNSIKGYQIPNEPDDISGGYILELEYQKRYPEGSSGFVTKRGQAVVLSEPKYASQAQVETVRKQMQAFENAIFSKNGIDTDSGKHYSQIMDMNSLTRKFVIEEILKNYDASKSSQYFYKPADSESTLLFAGPVWDYDSSLGNFAPEHNKKFFEPEYFCAATDTAMPFYIWSALYKQADFYETAVNVYHEVYKPLLRVLLGQEPGTGRLRSLDAYYQHIQGTAHLNFIRWPMATNRKLRINPGPKYWDQIAQLEDFITRRELFLDKEW
ncbi:MAG: CotH kinase family protein, partial [Clostridia bacterium]|nr:CotH kinase family protein [Clostridia bacterium]